MSATFRPANHEPVKPQSCGFKRINCANNEADDDHHHVDDDGAGDGLNKKFIYLLVSLFMCLLVCFSVFVNSLVIA